MGMDHPPSHGRHVDAIFRWAVPNSPATDYDRLRDICDAVDYLGVVSVGDGKGLVLTGTPVQTTAWWSSPSTGDNEDISSGGALVRWIYAENEEDIVQVFREIPEDAWTTEDFTFEVGMEPLYLFDSTETMSE